MLNVMGINHATSGAAVWIAATAALPALGLDVYPLAPAGVLSGALVCAGAALLPDADHKSATIAHSIPLVGELATDTVEHVSGGHRHAAHTLLAGAIVTAACVFIGRFTTHVPVFGEISLGPAIATVALVAFAVKARDFVKHWTTAWLLGLIAAVLVLVYSPNSTTWFPVAVAIGFVTHIAGDLLTVEGVPSLLWPIQIKPPRGLRRGPVAVFWHRNGYLSVPVLGHAGSAREHVLGVLLGVYCVYGAGVVAMQAMHLSIIAS
jgi:membrane-bound metal-dependent hydrolase YbcI (DUF457 family)